MSTHFGEHITIDGYGGSEEALNDRARVFACLSELPAILEMHTLSEPEIYHANANDKKDPGGWTGIVAIAESHISVHTFPKRGFVSADVYTCKNGMDVDRIVRFFTDTFSLKEVEQHFLIRGTRYPERNIY